MKKLFHENLEKIMKKRGINKKELAEAIGITPSAVTTWKTRNNYPTADKLKKICEVLKISADELLGLSPPEKKISEIPQNNQTDIAADERLLLENYRKATDKGKGEILTIAIQEGNRGQPEQKSINSRIG